MPLKKEFVDFPLVRSRDGGTDPKVTKSLLEAKNVVQDSTGAFNKRPGTTHYTYTADKTKLAAMMQVNTKLAAILGDKKTHLVGNRTNPLDVTFDNGVDLNAGFYLSARYNWIPLITYDPGNFYTLDPKAIAYLSSKNWLFVSDFIIDLNTRRLRASISTTPYVNLVAGGTAYAVYVSTDDLVWAAFNTATLALGATTNVKTLSGDSFEKADQFDVLAVPGTSGDYIAVAWYDTSGVLYVSRYDTSFASAGSDITVPTGATTYGIVRLFEYDTDKVGVAYTDGTTGFTYDIINLATGDITNGVQLDSGHTTALSVTAGYTEDLTEVYGWSHSASDTDYSFPVIQCFRVYPNDTDAPFLVVGVHTINNGLLMHTFAPDDTLYTSSLSQGHGTPLGLLFPGEVTEDFDGLGRVVTDGNGKFYFPLVVSGMFGVVEFEPYAPSPAHTVLDGRLLLFEGAAVELYDEMAGCFALGFPVTPTTLTGSPVSGGSIPDGTYYYKGVVEVTDRYGRVYRGRPTDAYEVTFGSGNNKVTISFDPSDNVYFGYLDYYESFKWTLYRTALGGTSYQKVGELSSTSGILDNLTDSQLGTFIYTDDGTLENDYPPPFLSVAQYKSFLVGIPQTDRTKIWQSKQITDGVGIEWSAFLTQRLPVRDQLTALAVMDDMIIAFEAANIHIITGSGYTNTGGGTGFVVHTLPQQVGAVDRSSVAVTPVGILFRSLHGWYLLDRSLQPQYVGRPVKDFDSTDIYSVRATDRQVYVHLQTTIILVFDLEHRTWVQWTGLEAVGSAEIDGSIYYALANGKLAEPRATYDDNGTDYLMVLDTDWIALDGIEGFQRVYEALVLGEYKTPHTLQISVYYDYVETAVETKTVVLTSDPAPYLFRFKLGRQKCTALRFRIEEVSPSDFKNSFTLTGLRLKIARKAKTPIASAKNIGG